MVWSIIALENKVFHSTFWYFNKNKTKNYAVSATMLYLYVLSPMVNNSLHLNDKPLRTIFQLHLQMRQLNLAYVTCLVGGREWLILRSDFKLPYNSTITGVGCHFPQSVKNLPAMQEIQVWFLGHEDPLEKEMTTHFRIFAWRIPWTEEPGGLQSMGLQESDTTEQLNHHHYYPNLITLGKY